MNRALAPNPAPPSNLRALVPALLAALALLLQPGARADDAGAAGAPAVGTIHVVPTEIEKSKGSLVIQLAANAHEYDNPEEASRHQIVKVVDKQAEAVFEGVPYGEYAIKIFHDENENEKLDTNFMGVPKERFGFSNNVMGRFGPPTFDQARFSFGEPHVTLEIRIHGIR